MKHTKKLVSLLLTLVMVLSMSITAFAAESSATKQGKITINNAIPGEKYTIYRIFDLESASETAYSYTVNKAWTDFFKEGAEGLEHVEIKNGYVYTKSDFKAAEFAEKALKYATENGITSVGVTQTAPEATGSSTTSTVVFDNLELGYYLVDSSLGVLCSLDTTNKEVIMQEKNAAPTVDKKVKEESNTENPWGDSNTAQIGDTVEFKTTIHAKKGAQNYVLHDKMEAGLTLIADSIKIDGLTKDEGYTVITDTTSITDECTFEIKFKQTYLDAITEDTNIVVTYSAILNEKAEIDSGVNENKTKLDYGDSSSTEWDTTETKTFQFDLVKTDSDNNLLNGAKFELYSAKTEGERIKLVEEDDGSYRVATADEQNVSGFTSAVIEAGKVTVKGLDANTTYWLEEIEAPAGYNKLTERQEVKMENDNLKATMNGDTWSEGGVHVINQTGAVLPSTGGIGTTIIYVAGSVLVLAAAVLLITKKRMSRDE